ncbi:MAG TPA: hypothetical protein VFB43_06225 [Terracidiphilus sp.]|nr:hypothetical protein [Terracidiphilus sp.]
MKRRGGVSGAGWLCIEAAAELLAPLEREVVLGDLAETGCGTWGGLSDVLGLAARRQLALWRSWRPWAASFGLALPASLFLMGCSLAASGAIANLLHELSSAPLLWRSVSRLFLLICWAWMAGFAVGAVSRGTWWASLLGCCAPCLYCLSEWPGHGLSALRLLIFLVPGLWGAWRGRQDLRLDLRWALFLAAMAMFTPLMWGKGGWMYGAWLLWPGCYLAVTAKHGPV